MLVQVLQHLINTAKKLLLLLLLLYHTFEWHTMKISIPPVSFLLIGEI